MKMGLRQFARARSATQIQNGGRRQTVGPQQRQGTQQTKWKTRTPTQEKVVWTHAGHQNWHCVTSYVDALSQFFAKEVIWPNACQQNDANGNVLAKGRNCMDGEHKTSPGTGAPGQ
jgi:hypothetical protein